MSPLLILATVLVFLSLVCLLAGTRFVPNDRVGIVEKRFGGDGERRSLIALGNEPGFRPELLRGGLYWLAPFVYRVHVVPLVTIPQGKIGYLYAREGAPLASDQVLASNADARDFEDVRAFLGSGGQRGPQRLVLRQGTHAIHLVQFAVITEGQTFFVPLSRDELADFDETARLIAERGGFEPVVIDGAHDSVGIVTVHDGPPLRDGEIIAPSIGAADGDAHTAFQDAEAFLAAGGRRGRQIDVLVEGTYYINRLFATVELVPKTIVEVGFVGVVVSYTGAEGSDLSGADYKHGELVETGLRGVWRDALMPGKYPFNTSAGKVVMVPTTNFILKWIRSESGAHRYDENLAEVSLITKDAFEPSLPLSVVVHIDYRKAPLVVQRFGDIRRLVEQTLDPMVSAYFKNVAQTRTLIQLLQDRSQIQTAATMEMRDRFAHYNLELEEVLIGTPTSPAGRGEIATPGDLVRPRAQGGEIETILAQLRSRQIAEEQIETYGRQERAAVKERDLREAESRAKQQAAITESELAITLQSNQGKAEYQRSVQEASRIQTLAGAEAGKIRALAEAEAERAARVGIGEAIAIDEQVRAYGGPQFQLSQQVMIRFAEAIEKSGIDLVPRIVVGGGGNGSAGSVNGANVVEGLLTMLLSDRLGAVLPADRDRPRSAMAEAMRTSIVEASKPAKKG
jgi:uncharacterized membrane protein YqiK